MKKNKLMILNIFISIILALLYIRNLSIDIKNKNDLTKTTYNNIEIEDNRNYEIELLIGAIQNEEKDKINSILSKNIDLNIETQNSTPLMEAVLKNDTDLVQRLIKFGADIDFKTSEGKIPILQARTFEMLETLINLNANVNVRSEYGSTLLAFILMSWNDSFSKINAINLLVKLGVNVDAVDNSGKSIFKDYIQDTQRFTEEEEKIVKLLISYSKQKEELLIEAIENKNVKMSKWLVEDGADVNILTNKRESLLLKAVQRNNWYDSDFANEANLSMAALLLNAKLKIRESEKKDLIYYAVSLQNIELVKLLIKNGCNILENALWEAIDNRNDEIIKILVDAGVDVNTKNNYEQTPLAYVLERDGEYEPSVKILINAGAKQ